MIEYLPHMACLFGGFIAGAGLIAWRAAGKAADLTNKRNQPLIDASAAIEQSRELDAAHARVTDALAAKNARIATLTDIARSQQSVKSGRIIDVLEG